MTASRCEQSGKPGRSMAAVLFAVCGTTRLVAAVQCGGCRMQQYSLQSSAYTSSIPIRDYRPTWLQARALFAYDATGETELSMREGDVISVLKVQCCKDQTDSAISTHTRLRQYNEGFVSSHFGPQRRAACVGARECAECRSPIALCTVGQTKLNCREGIGTPDWAGAARLRTAVLTRYTGTTCWSGVPR